MHVRIAVGLIAGILALLSLTLLDRHRTSTPEEPPAKGALLRVYLVDPFKYFDDTVPRPLYYSDPADRRALTRIARQVAEAKLLEDPALRALTGPPTDLRALHLVYPDGRESQIVQAHRCPVGVERPASAQCKVEPDAVILDGRPVHSPPLYRYLFVDEGFEAEMLPVIPLELVEPSGSRVKPGQPIVLRGEGALVDPVPIRLIRMASDSVEQILTTVEAPVGKWSWQGEIPAETPGGLYRICAADRLCLFVKVE